MARGTAFNATTVGRKITMGLAGIVLYGFVFFHMLGNLKVYQGPEAFNHYAEGLRTFGDPFVGRGQLLWLIRLILIAAALVHIVFALQLWAKKRAARQMPYRKFESLAFSFTSRTMTWGGIAILAFVIFHLMHLTFGNAHPDFVPGDAYHNFVTGFRSVPVSLAYIAAMIPLGFHLYHGFWSVFQTLGASNPAYNRWRRPLAAIIAVAIVVANISFPIAVLTGVVR